MRKVIPFLIFIMLIPLLVIADECTNDLEVLSLKKTNAKGEVLNEELTMKNGSIILNNIFYHIDDEVIYNITVKNNGKEDYTLDESRLHVDGKYTDYTIDYGDSSTIKSGEEKDIVIKIKYVAKASEEDFSNNKLNDDMEINLGTTNMNVSMPEELKSSKSFYYIILILVIFIGGIYTFGDLKKSGIFVLLLMLFIPIYGYAECENKINILSNVIIVNSNDCEYDDELVEGKEYTNGSYTYRYKEEFDSSSWRSISVDGWGIKYNGNTDDSITTKVCTSIGTKPIVSTSYAYYKSNAKKVDLTTIDTSNVVNMEGMFKESSFDKLNLSLFDTNRVTNMSNMFEHINIDTLDLSSFTIDKVNKSNDMFNSSSIKNGYGRGEKEVKFFNETQNKPNELIFTINN